MTAAHSLLKLLALGAACSGSAASVASPAPMRLRGGEVLRSASRGDLHGPMLKFSHSPMSYFALDLLTEKGPKANADVGSPTEATRPLCTVGSASTGSWHCTEGGWECPVRESTEVFYVLEGAGSVTDTDGHKHDFAAGDTVILPRGWSGRWDVTKAMQNVWLVHEHPEQPRADNEAPIRAQVVQLVRDDSSRCVYEVGPTSVSIWARSPAPPRSQATFQIAGKDAGYAQFNRPTTKWMHVVEGVFFVTNADGSAQRCGPGDTLLVPKGWSGHWDIIEPCKAVSVTVFD
jgi:uncharacterized protein